jgi:hypothetical protein
MSGNGLLPSFGVPPGSPQLAGGVSYSPALAPAAGCEILYHKVGCRPDFSREQANFLLANLLAVFDKAGLPYDCSDPLLLWKSLPHVTATGILPGYQSGQWLVKTATTMLQVTAGTVAADSGDALIRLNNALAKNVAAPWVAGSGLGASDAGGLGANVWGHVFSISKDDGTSDWLVSTSPTAPTMPAGYTKKRIRGSILMDGSGNITSFLQYDDTFYWVTPVKDIYDSSGPVSEAATIRTLRTPPGRRCMAFGSMLFGYTSQGTGIYISPLDTDDMDIFENPGGPSNIAAGIPALINVVEGSADGEASSGVFDVLTNTAAQVRSKVRSAAGNHQYSGASSVFIMSTLRWRDWRI